MPPVIRTNDRSRRATVDLRLRPRGHWDRHTEDKHQNKKTNAYYAIKKEQEIRTSISVVLRYSLIQDPRFTGKKIGKIKEINCS
jgi:hypothetical protein